MFCPFVASGSRWLGRRGLARPASVVVFSGELHCWQVRWRGEVRWLSISFNKAFWSSASPATWRIVWRRSSCFCIKLSWREQNQKSRGSSVNKRGCLGCLCPSSPLALSAGRGGEGGGLLGVEGVRGCRQRRFSEASSGVLSRRTCVVALPTLPPPQMAVRRLSLAMVMAVLIPPGLEPDGRIFFVFSFGSTAGVAPSGAFPGGGDGTGAGKTRARWRIPRIGSCFSFFLWVLSVKISSLSATSQACKDWDVNLYPPFCLM